MGAHAVLVTAGVPIAAVVAGKVPAAAGRLPAGGVGGCGGGVLCAGGEMLGCAGSSFPPAAPPTLSGGAAAAPTTVALEAWGGIVGVGAVLTSGAASVATAGDARTVADNS